MKKRIFDLQKVYILIELNDILEYTFKIVQIKLKEYFNNLNYKGMIILGITAALEIIRLLQNQCFGNQF